MSDPYAVLGIDQRASDEEVKRAYRELVKKYHPDNYQNNPLSELAEEKMKEVNEAYDAIVKQRTGGNYQSYGGAQGYSRQQGQSTEPSYIRAREMIDRGNLNEAQRVLEATGNRSGEWYYLMGSIAYRRGWLAEARDNFRVALNMEPGNMEYRQAVEHIERQANRGFETYQRGSASNDWCMPFLCGACLCGNCG